MKAIFPRRQGEQRIAKILCKKPRSGHTALCRIDTERRTASSCSLFVVICPRMVFKISVRFFFIIPIAPIVTEMQFWHLSSKISWCHFWGPAIWSFSWFLHYFSKNRWILISQSALLSFLCSHFINHEYAASANVESTNVVVPQFMKIKCNHETEFYFKIL